MATPTSKNDLNNEFQKYRDNKSDINDTDIGSRIKEKYGKLCLNYMMAFIGQKKYKYSEYEAVILLWNIIIIMKEDLSHIPKSAKQKMVHGLCDLVLEKYKGYTTAIDIIKKITPHM